MTELHDLIREKLSARAGDEGFMWHAQAAAAIEAVLEKHTAYGVYDICGHEHEESTPGVREVDDVGLVCDDGYLYSICFHCCAWDYGQTEACASNHDPESCWPCPTVRVIAEKLGLIAAVET